MARADEGRPDQARKGPAGRQGVANTKVRARIQVGIDKHAQLQTGCTAHEYQIPDGRIDCLNVSDGRCEVIEIKPNNEKARAKGREQLDGYKPTIVGLHADNKLTELLARCVKDGQLNIEYEIEVYEFCPVPNIDAMLAEQAKQSTSTATNSRPRRVAPRRPCLRGAAFPRYSDKRSGKRYSPHDIQLGNSDSTW